MNLIATGYAPSACLASSAPSTVDRIRNDQRELFNRR